jgi:hypothetical protein
VRRRVTRLCYWNGGDPDEISIIELDELGFNLLSLVDGKRSIADFNHLFGSLNDAFAALASVGVISLG